MALPSKNRLRSSRDFSKVYRKGKRATTQNLAVRALKCSSRKQVSGLKSGSTPSMKSSSEKSMEKGEKQEEKQRARPRLKHIKKSVDGKPSALLMRPAFSDESDSQANSQGPCFGISISRKVHKRAVVRNRIKRQLKAIIRARYMAIAPEWKIVIVVRPPAVECSFDDFLRELEYLLQKLAIV